MDYIAFHIHKYKAVKDVHVRLNRSLIPIIGINESGKTSILQAILAFDKYGDHYFDGKHLNAKNRYEINSKDHIVAASVKFDDQQEVDYFLSFIGSKRTNQYKKYKSKLNSSSELKLIRYLDTKEYKIEIEGENVTDAALTKKWSEYILREVPYLLYFDDFTERVPNLIEFPSSYFRDESMELETQSSTDSSQHSKQIDKTFKPTEWNKYIEEIFLRTSDGAYDLETFVNTSDKDDQRGMLADVSAKLNEDVISDWMKLRLLQRTLGSEMSELELKLLHDRIDEKEVFYFKVTDKKFRGRERTFSIDERSKGFQWFFNFAIKLKYNTKYTSEEGGAIYLLDEPGSYLHSSAQEELLHSLQNISSNNNVIYCTHSQYLLNPDKINIANIRIADRNSKTGEIRLVNFGEYDQVNKWKGALSPLYDALFLNVGGGFAIKESRVLITEGITEYYFLTMYDRFNGNRLDGINIIPGSSASNLKELISFAISMSEKYSVLLDSDSDGLDARDRYEQFFGEQEARNFYLLETTSKKNQVELESLLHNRDKERIREYTGKRNLKKAFAALFYMEESKIKEIMGILHPETLKNIDLNLSKINLLPTT